nr:MAG TPA: hypothetical protein [Caudoviricetes sp.]
MQFFFGKLQKHIAKTQYNDIIKAERSVRSWEII